MLGSFLAERVVLGPMGKPSEARQQNMSGLVSAVGFRRPFRGQSVKRF